MAHDVFVSYSPEDKPIADGICANLETAGLRCWIAPRDIEPGDDRPSAITRAISASRVMVLVFSQSANQSDDISRELYMAATNKVIIVPFKIEDVQPEAGKEYYLGRTHWLDAMNPPTLEQIGQLVDRIQSLLQVEPETKPTQPGEELKKSRRSVFSRTSRRGWFLRGILFLLAAGVLVTGFFVLPQVVSSLTAQPIPTLSAVDLTYLFKEDFNNPKYDGALPPLMSIPGNSCQGMTVAQENGNLSFQLPASITLNCLVHFDQPPFRLAKIKSIEYTLRTNSLVEGNTPDIAPLFDAADSSNQNLISVICDLGRDAKCVVRVNETELYASKIFIPKPMEDYKFVIDILDPDKMVFQFSVNGQALGDYALPADKAAAWNGMDFRIHAGVVGMLPNPNENTYTLDNIAILAR